VAWGEAGLGDVEDKGGGRRRCWPREHGWPWTCPGQRLARGFFSFRRSPKPAFLRPVLPQTPSCLPGQRL
jgi:hypothetical protein